MVFALIPAARGTGRSKTPAHPVNTAPVLGANVYNQVLLYLDGTSIIVVPLERAVFEPQPPARAQTDP